MRISDWSSDVCSSDLVGIGEGSSVGGPTWSSECAETIKVIIETYLAPLLIGKDATNLRELQHLMERAVTGNYSAKAAIDVALHDLKARSEEHTSELQSLMRISYAVFCLKKKRTTQNIHVTNNQRNHAT